MFIQVTRPMMLPVVASMCLGGTLMAGPDELPLLAPGARVGVIYSSSDPVSGPSAEPLWNQSLAQGIDVYQLAMTWSDLEPVPGVIDTTVLEAFLGIIESTGMVPYLSLATINTNQLAIPADLLNPGQPTELAVGLSWDHPTVLARFAAVIDAVAPLLVQYGGFYVSVGNEVDIYLSARPAALSTQYAAFLGAARTRAQLAEPDLAVGATLTFEALGQPAVLSAVLGASDVPSFTYYAVSGFVVRDPSQVAGDLDAILTAAGTKPVLLQEVGCPSGWRDAPLGTPGAGPGGGPTNASSEALQGEFVDAFFDAMLGRPRIRMASFMQLADYSDDLLDLFEAYYGISDPSFREFLGTLGLAWIDGTPKPGFARFLEGVCRVRRARADLNQDGLLDNGDISAFIAVFLAQGPTADLNGDGIVDNGDIATFVGLFLSSC